MTHEKACPCCGGGEYAEENKKTVIPEESGAAETCCGEDKKAADGGAADGEPTACCNTMGSGNGCGCCGKTTERPERERQKLIHRLNRIEGQQTRYPRNGREQCVLCRYSCSVGSRECGGQRL